MKRILSYVVVLAILYVAEGCTKPLNNPEPNNPEPQISEDTSISIFYRMNNYATNTNELWSVKSDGTGNQKIDIALPSGWQLNNKDMAEISKDGKMLVVTAYNSTLNKTSIFKCNIDGTDVQQIITLENHSLAILGFIDQNSILYWKSSPHYVLKPGEAQPPGLWRINVDGTGNQKINIILPTAFVGEESAKVTSDGKTIVFLAKDKNTFASSLYKCNIDGSNVSWITSETADYSLSLQGLKDDNTILYRKSKVMYYNLNELWSVNIDGTNDHKINITLSTGSLQKEEMAKVSNEGMLFFSTSAMNASPFNYVIREAIYTANLDGSSVKLVTQIPSDYNIAIQSLAQ